VAAETLQKTIADPPFLHLTFLDAYTPSKSDADTYGKLADPHFSEHYVDIGLWYTDTKLPNAVNFDITNWDMTGWEHLSKDDKREWGHQWPRYWYEKSVTTPTLTSLGYNFTFESRGTEFYNEYSLFRPSECFLVDKLGLSVCSQ
jgi:hypothetical protein